jgi:hypothetical protein
MIWINQFRLSLAKPRIAQPHLGKTFLGAVILTLLWGTLAAIAEDETENAKISDPGRAERPTSGGWLDNYVKGLTAENAARADDTSMRLATELVKKGPVDIDFWSQRSESEIRSAIEHDDLLKNNDWSSVRCTKSGCIAAIESLDPSVTARMDIYLDRLVSYLTPRSTSSSRHPDWTEVEVQPGTAKSSVHRHVVFFVFADRSAAERATH